MRGRSSKFFTDLPAVVVRAQFRYAEIRDWVSNNCFSSCPLAGCWVFWLEGHEKNHKLLGAIYLQHSF